MLLPLLPAFEGDISSESGGIALRTILHFNYSSICRGPQSIFRQLQMENINPSNYISFCSLRQKGELLGSQVTELVYIHSKLMIVDDKIVICGSANINDRSLLGSRDSEMSVIIEDTEFEEGTMDGQKVEFGKFAGNLRLKLMQEHLGSIDIDLKDCISDSFYKDVWLKIASKNTKLFEETFLCLPTDEVKTMDDNKKYLLKRSLAHSDKFLALQKMKEVQGYLVLLPLSYLEDTNLLPGKFVKEGMVPTRLWT